MRDRLAPEQLNSLKALLQSRQAALRDVIRDHLLKSDDDRTRLLADRVRDEEDESVADLIIDLDLAEIDRDVEEIREVEAALERINESAYGICLSCQGSIPYDRLAAYPTATRCVRCQSVHEKTHAGTRTPAL